MTSPGVGLVECLKQAPRCRPVAHVTTLRFRHDAASGASVSRCWTLPGYVDAGTSGNNCPARLRVSMSSMFRPSPAYMKAILSSSNASPAAAASTSRRPGPADERPPRRPTRTESRGGAVRHRDRASAWTGEVGSVGSMSLTCIDLGFVRKTTLTFCRVFVMIFVTCR